MRVQSIAVDAARNWVSTVRVVALTLLLAAGLFSATPTVARGDGAVEYLMVPSASMGRDIPVAFHAGGPHAVFLLDAFNAGENVSNWITAGNAMASFAGKGVSVVAPAGGAYSLYTNWEQDGTKQWETFLAAELPDWLAATRGVAPGGHAIVGASQGGTAALTLAAFHPDRFEYAGSMSGFLYPSNTAVNGALTTGMANFGGVDTRNMWGAAQLGRWKWHDPWVHIGKLLQNNTRLWIYSPGALVCTDPAAMVDACAQAHSTNRDFYQQYRQGQGNNAHVDLGNGGNHDWAGWGPQLAAMSADVAASIK